MTAKKTNRYEFVNAKEGCTKVILWREYTLRAIIHESEETGNGVSSEQQHSS